MGILGKFYFTKSRKILLQRILEYREFFWQYSTAAACSASTNTTPGFVLSSRVAVDIVDIFYFKMKEM